MQIVNRPDTTLRPPGLPFHKLRGPLQAIVNEPRKFGLTPTGGGIPVENAEEELRPLLTAGFVKGIHDHLGGQQARVPEEVLLQIVGNDVRKTMECGLAAGGSGTANSPRLVSWTRGSAKRVCSCAMWPSFEG